MRVADYVMKCISEIGVRHVFQVTGRGSLFLSDALAKSEILNGVSMHHEQACAFAAISYAEQNESIGACLVSTGCASTNAITGVLSAWQDGIPTIFISGQNILKETSRYSGIPLRTYGQQEADIVSIVQSITKFSSMVTSPQQIYEVMEKAVFESQNNRKGPVWIDIPLDIQSSMIDPDVFKPMQQSSSFKKNKVKKEDIQRFLRLINNSNRPVILIGRGVRSSGAEKKLISFIEKNSIPVVYTASAPDTYGTSNKLSIGSVGSMGCSRAGNFALQNSDLLIVLGSRLSSLNTGPDHSKFARDAKVCVIDIDPIEHSKDTISIDLLIEADILDFLQHLDPIKLHLQTLSWVNKCYHWKNIFSKVEPEFRSVKDVDLYQLSETLSNTLPKNCTLLTDSGLNEVILPSNIKIKNSMKCIHPTSQGAMGFALPASIGAALASINPVITIIGDGSIMMNLQELDTISNKNLNIKIIIINNNMYSIIRRRQKDLFRKRTIGTDPKNGLSAPNFKKIASSFGLSFMKINNVKNLNEGIKKLFEYKGPALCEIKGRDDQGYIEIGQTKSMLTNRFVRRPLEDQKPFLERDLFLKEMIIEPIDQ